MLEFHGTPEGVSIRQNIDQRMVFKRLNEDLDAFMTRDPAARSRLEVVLCYSGLHAILIHRLAHGLRRGGFFLLSRIVSQFGRWITGVEIHPGATIGRRFVIDHGQGIVIGETAEIGEDVTLYQGVTLGGIAPAVDSHSQVSVKRHPTLRDGVIVGSGAQILGPIVIGERARVGANSVVTHDVPPGITAVGIPAHEVRPRERSGEARFCAYGTPAEGCPDPLSAELNGLRAQVAALVSAVADLEMRLQATQAGQGKKGDGEDDTTAGMRQPVDDHDAAHW